MFKVHYGLLTLKIYSKGERVLRIEAIVHNTKELPHCRPLERFPRVVEQLRQMVDRFREALHSVDACYIADDTLEQLPEPGQVGKTKVGGIDCKPITGEITYGLERLAMYLQGVENVFDLTWTDGLTYRDVYYQNEVEQSAYNFEHSDVEFLLTAFGAHEKQARHLMEQKLALPAYEQVLKAAHTFNLLDARGAISVTERAAYIGRIRNLARAVAKSYLDSRARLGFPLAPKAWAEEVQAQLANKEAA